MRWRKSKEVFLYDLKDSLLTVTEMEYLEAIEEVMPEGCMVQVQANLAAFIKRTDGARYQNELFRNVDFLITDLYYRPLVVIEVNDRTHFMAERRARDEKVAEICEEAGIPIITLWTSYGVNPDYIEKRLEEALDSLPVKRIAHSAAKAAASKKKGCYIATCVYGSYDCPEVWTLRRFRDQELSRTWYGRMFIRIYYGVSPVIVKYFGQTHLFKHTAKRYLDWMVGKLASRGIKPTPYHD